MHYAFNLPGILLPLRDLSLRSRSFGYPRGLRRSDNSSLLGVAASLPVNF
jgi:hypothetical protein